MSLSRVPGNGARRLIYLLGVGVLASASLAACGSSGTSPTSTGSSSAAAPASTSSEPSSATGLAGATDQTPVVTSYNPAFAVKYIEGTAGPAHASEPPVEIGWVNEDAGPASDPEMTAAAKIAVQLINAKLGGIHGAPLKLVTCSTTSIEQTQQCADQFANNHAIKMIVQGQISNVGGEDTLYQAASATNKPLIIAQPNGPADDQGQGPFAFLTGGNVQWAVLDNLITSGKLGKVTKASIVYIDVPAAYGARDTVQSQLKAANISVSLVGVPPTANGPGWESAVASAGGASANVVGIIGTSDACVAVAQFLKSVHSTAKIVGPTSCFGPAVIQALGTIPNGYYSTVMSNYLIPDAVTGTNIYLGAMRQYGGPNIEVGIFAPQGFAGIMNAARFLNQIGPDKINVGSFRSAAEAFKGPAYMAPGVMQCGKIKNNPALCSSYADIYEWDNGKWLSVESSLSGNPANGANGL